MSLADGREAAYPSHYFQYYVCLFTDGEVDLSWWPQGPYNGKMAAHKYMRELLPAYQRNPGLLYNQYIGTFRVKAGSNPPWFGQTRRPAGS
jgi:hypothetical protein